MRTSLLLRQDVYTAGGTVQAGSGLYIARQADAELLALCQAGAFAYVLASRQMGKSSLMVHTATMLNNSGVRSITIDISGFGVENIMAEQWFFGLLETIKIDLDLGIDLNEWWQSNANLGLLQRLTHFLEHVVLNQIQEPIVIFLDEIETTIKYPYSDDFFAAIRYIYNARATIPAFKRLSFVLIGMALPGELIKDPRRTPFNIGSQVELTDFTGEEAGPFARGLEGLTDQAEQVLGWVLEWTDGHPYLTQKLCLDLIRTQKKQWTRPDLDRFVQQTFSSEEVRKETNLRFIEDYLRASSDWPKLWGLYRQIYRKKVVLEEEQSFVHNQLKLSGLVKVKAGALVVRNNIYHHVFNAEWIKARTPVNRLKRVAVAAVLVALVVTVLAAIFISQERQRTIDQLAQAYAADFKGNISADIRLNSLTSLFELPGYQPQARALFHNLPPAEKLALFRDAGEGLQQQVLTVIKGTYLQLEDTPDNNQLLAAMEAVLLAEDAESRLLASEIDHWLAGRAAAASGAYDLAEIAYSTAIQLNEANPVTHLERAGLSLKLGKAEAALADLEATLGLDQSRSNQVQAIIEANPELYEIWRQAPESYPNLTALLPTPTPTATATVPPSPLPIAVETATPRPPPSPSPTLLPPTPSLTPTATPSPTPTASPTAASSATTTPTQTPTFAGDLTLLSPKAGVDLSSERRVTFVWRWNGPDLGPDQAFEILIWQAGEPNLGAYDARETMKQLQQEADGSYSLTIDILGAEGVKRSGEYLWTVGIVELDPYRRTPLAAEPQPLVVAGYDQASSRSASESSGDLPPVPTSPPP
jgi:hypothetical protein